MTIISIILVGFIIEGSVYLVQSNQLIKQGYRFPEGKKRPPFIVRVKPFASYYEEKKQEENLFTVSGESYKNNPILLFGDVFAKSLDLPEDKSMSAKLADLTKSPVYNFASPGWGIQHLYFLLKNEEFISTIKSPKTLVYVYNPYQIVRLNSFSYYPHHSFLNLKYKMLNGSLIEQNPRCLLCYNFYTVRALEKQIGLNRMFSNSIEKRDEIRAYIKSLFLNSKKIAQVKYPTIENFVILRIVDPEITISELKNSDNEDYNHAYDMWKELEDNGYKIIDITDLIADDWRKEENRSSDSGLSEKALDEILPVFIDKAGLNSKVLTKKNISTNLKKKRK